VLQELEDLLLLLPLVVAYLLDFYLGVYSSALEKESLPGLAY
jgi:hypothetical protein